MQLKFVFLLQDPFTLYVFLDEKQSAKGELYIDDGHSFAFKKGAFTKVQFSFEDGKLINKVSPNGSKPHCIRGRQL